MRRREVVTLLSVAEQQRREVTTLRGIGVYFATKREALAYYRDEIRPRLDAASSVHRSTTLAELVELYLAARSDLEASSRVVLRDRLNRALGGFGGVRLDELERMAPEIAAWRSTLAEGSRYGATQALRQVLEQAVRWGAMRRNPARDAGANPAPKRAEVRPYSRGELDALCAELGDAHARLVRVAAETGLRPAGGSRLSGATSTPAPACCASSGPTRAARCAATGRPPRAAGGCR